MSVSMNHNPRTFNIPEESGDYEECSRFVTDAIESIIQNAIEIGKNRILINTNLKLGLPMENINKVAGPFVEAWVAEIFYETLEDGNNNYHLVDVQAMERLHMADLILHFRRKRKASSDVTAEVDVKSTATDLGKSGKSPNITSYARIRTAYVNDPDYLFVVLSLKHKAFSARNRKTGMMDGVMEIVSCSAYDLKFLSSQDLIYNPSLGTGQIQVRDVHQVDTVVRTTWDFCQLLDEKYLQSAKKDMRQWLELANKHGWIDADD